MKKAGIVVSLTLCLILLSASAFAWDTVHRSFGQTVYAPAWRNFAGKTKYNTNSVVLIRNIDPDSEITIVSAKLYNHTGLFLKDYLATSGPITLYPLGDSTNIPPCTGTSIGVTCEGKNNIGFWIAPNEIKDPPLVLLGRPSVVIVWVADEKVIPPLITTTVFAYSEIIKGTVGIMSVDSRVIQERWLPRYWWMRN